MCMNGLATKTIKTLGATKQESRDLHMTFLNREENWCHSCVLGDECRSCDKHMFILLEMFDHVSRVAISGEGMEGTERELQKHHRAFDPSLARYFHGGTSTDQQTHHFQVAFESRQMQRRIASLILAQILQLLAGAATPISESQMDL